MDKEPSKKKKYPHLSRAPIEEALVDIQVQLSPDFLVSKFQNIAKTELITEFPTQKTQRIFQGKINLNSDAPAGSVENRGINGYVLVSGDGRRVLQFRKNGFTLSHLRPYDRWTSLRDESKRWWNVYQSAVGEMAVVRAALRYINQLELPITALDDLGKYLVAPPKVPTEDAGQKVGFENRVFVRFAQTNRHAVITQILNPTPMPKSLQFILDIDTFFTGSPKIETEAIWSMFEELHDFKNLLFFKSLRSVTWERYR